ncbi:hypothetical protein QE152_g41437, partial [Popillia japonica]
MIVHQLFAHIFNNTVQNITVCENYTLADWLVKQIYGSEGFALECTQIPCEIGDICENGHIFRIEAETGKKIEIIPVPNTEQQLSNLSAETEFLKKTLNPTIDIKNCTLDELKEWQIRLSKSELVIYLQEHPLVSDCHGGKIGTYTITEEKQSLFTSKYTAHMALIAAGIEDIMTWNETGKECEAWTDEECIKFISEWNDISTPLVAHQQKIELRIKAAISKEEVL